jgi:hypothetical protein
MIFESLSYFKSVLFLTQWNVSEPKNCTPNMAYRLIKNRKNIVTLYICELERLIEGIEEM